MKNILKLLCLPCLAVSLPYVAGWVIQQGAEFIAGILASIAILAIVEA